MSLAFDEYGRPFIIIRDQEGKSRMKVRFERPSPARRRRIA
eukprot:COSAG02_NODE_25875_length_646_cov_2.043876_1_plen_40_part_01